MRVVVEEANDEGVCAPILGEDAVKHTRGTILDNIGVVVTMGRRHMVTVRIHSKVMARVDRLGSVLLVVVSAH